MLLKKLTSGTICRKLNIHSPLLSSFPCKFTWLRSEQHTRKYLSLRFCPHFLLGNKFAWILLYRLIQWMLNVFWWNIDMCSILGRFPNFLKTIRGFLLCSVNQTEDTVSNRHLFILQEFNSNITKLLNPKNLIIHN